MEHDCFSWIAHSLKDIVEPPLEDPVGDVDLLVVVLETDDELTDWLAVRKSSSVVRMS